MNYLHFNQFKSPRLTALALSLVLAGCLTPPPKDAAPTLHQPVASELAPSNLVQWPAQDWWKKFNDAQLNDLIQRALTGSPTLAVAQARVLQAKAGANATAANAGANLAVGGNVTRQLFSENYIYPPPLGGAYDTSGQFDLELSYDLDFWGRNRAAIQAAIGQQEAAQADAYSAAASLSASIAKTYFQWQAVNAHMATLKEVEAKRGALIQLEKNLVSAGIRPGDNLHPLVADQAAPDQTLIQLQSQSAQLRYTLQALVGAHELPSLTPQALPEVSGGVPKDIHIDLLARRADISAAKLRIDSALSDVDSARAAFYPDFSISAFIGMNSLYMGRLLHKSSQEMGVAPAFHLPIFDAGRLRANLDAQRTDVTIAIAEYDQAVVNAVSDVNNAVVQLDGTQKELAPLIIQHKAHEKRIAAADQRLAAGLGTQRDVLTEQLIVLGLDDQETTRHANALSAEIDLIKALGGGYVTPHGN